jgi:hypothetical protein
MGFGNDNLGSEDASDIKMIGTHAAVLTMMAKVTHSGEVAEP